MDLRIKSGGIGHWGQGQRWTDLLRKEASLIITTLRIILINQFWKKSYFGDLFIFIYIYIYIMGFLRTLSSEVLTVISASSAFGGKKTPTQNSPPVTKARQRK